MLEQMACLSLQVQLLVDAVEDLTDINELSLRVTILDMNTKYAKFSFPYMIHSTCPKTRRPSSYDIYINRPFMTRKKYSNIGP